MLLRAGGRGVSVYILMGRTPAFHLVDTKSFNAGHLRSRFHPRPSVAKARGGKEDGWKRLLQPEYRLGERGTSKSSGPT